MRIWSGFLYIILGFLYLVNAQENTFFDKLNWLEGSWRYETNKTIFVENWKKVSDNTYEGNAFDIKKESSDTTFSETLRLLAMSGDVFYTAYVKHNKYPVPFKLTSQNPDSLVFENAEHDFPQKVIYYLKDKNTFVVHVEGMDKGKMRSFELLYKKAE